MYFSFFSFILYCFHTLSLYLFASLFLSISLFSPSTSLSLCLSLPPSLCLPISLNTTQNKEVPYLKATHPLLSSTIEQKQARHIRCKNTTPKVTILNKVIHPAASNSITFPYTKIQIKSMLCNS